MGVDPTIRTRSSNYAKVRARLGKVAPGGNKYSARVQKIVAGLNNADGIALNYKAYLVTDVNAFAMANGCVRVFAGVMGIATDDKIRSAVGHKISHAKLRHTGQKWKRC